MADYCRSVKCNLRPHVKAHKSAFIGKKQLAAGAIGLCAQTLDEAEAMIYGGLDHVLLTNMLISKNSVDRFLNLARNSDSITTVDSVEGVEILGKAASLRGQKVGVLVEIDVGQKRTGVEPGENAAKLAAEVVKTPGLEFRGLMGYEGFLQLSIPGI